MPHYDFFVIFKPSVERRTITDILMRLGRRVYQQNGVVTDVKSFGKQCLAYAIKKRDGRHYEGQMMQMTMMVTPKFNEQLQFLNDDNRLLRWVLVKHRGTKWLDALNGKYPSVAVQEDELFRSR